MNILKAIFLPTKINLNVEHEVEECFASGGVKYFKFVNEFKIPYGRAMAAADIYKELEEMTDSKYHKTSYNLVIEYLRQGKNDLAAIVAHNSIERMDNICNADLMYKLASVLYFDVSENPYTYDPEYAERKIKKWKKDEKIDAFFLKTPLADYLPYFDGSVLNIMDYTEAQRKSMLLILKSHLSELSENSKNYDLISTLQSQIKELEELVLSS